MSKIWCDTGTAAVFSQSVSQYHPDSQRVLVFQSNSNTDVHTVASLLKLYLRELPEPVIPYTKYEDFLSCAKILSKEEEMVSWQLVQDEVKHWHVITCPDFEEEKN